MIKSFRTVLPIVSVVVVATLAGCSGEAASTSSDDSQAKTALAANDGPSAKPHGDRHFGRPQGPDSLVFAALHENIGLSDAQRETIKGLVASVHAHKAPSQAPDKARSAAFASAIRSGKVEATAFAPPAQNESARQERLAKVASNLKTLHDTLTKDQRVALVQAIQSRRAGGAEKGEHVRGARGEMGPLGHLTEGLNLTQAQKDQIRAKLTANEPSETDRAAMKAQFESMKKEMGAKLLAFENDDFDANAFVAPPANAPQMKMNPAAHMQKELDAVLSVLDANQREQLAQRIEQGPPARR